MRHIQLLGERFDDLFFQKQFEIKYKFAILDIHEQELLYMDEYCMNPLYFEEKNISKDKLHLILGNSVCSTTVSYDETRFVPLFAVSDFTENPLHIVKVFKFEKPLDDADFRNAVNAVQKKLLENYIFFVPENDPRLEMTPRYYTSYVFDPNPIVVRQLRNILSEDDINSIANEAKAKPVVQIQEWFKSINELGVYCVGVLEDKKVIINITLFYSEIEKVLQFKFEVEEDGIPTKKVWTTICENDSRIFIRTCEAMGDFLEKEYGIVGAEMTIEEWMYLQTRDN